MESLLRPAITKDVPALIELQTRSITQLSIPYYTPQQIEAIARSQQTARSADETCLIAEVAGEIVGFAALIKKHSQISAVFVRPDFARQGIGAKLLADLETQAHHHNCRLLRVMSSLAAVEFYQAQGYQVVHKCRFWTSDRIWIPCVQLEKRLVPLTASEKTTQPSQLIGALLLLLLLGVLIFAPPKRNFSSQVPNVREILR
jgi:putative acetyltransferase